MESDEWENGVFTLAILKGLEIIEKTDRPVCDLDHDRYASVSELKSYVSIEVEKLTNGRQKLTNRQGNLEFDFKIW